MTTRRRARVLRTGLVAALAAAATLGFGLPAYAEAPTVVIDSVSSGTLPAGGNPSNVRFTINDADKPNAPVTIEVTFEGVPNGAITCTGPCDTTQPMMPNDWPKQFEVQIRAAGGAQTDQGTLRIKVTVEGESSSATRSINIQGAQQPPAPATVKEISGKVVDVFTGTPIKDALVMISDGADTAHEDRTDSNGVFRITGTATKPIAPGEIIIGAQADSYKPMANPKTVNAAAGQTVNNVRLTLESLVAPTLTPSAGAPVEDTLAPTGDASVSPAGGSGEDEGGGFFSVALIGVGGLLVALGVGAIVLLLVRRRDDGDEDEQPAKPRSGPVPAGRGAYRGAPGAGPTRVANRSGADPTVLARSPMADAPTTMLSPRGGDPYADPYGAPPMRPGAPGYGGAQPGYGTAPQSPAYGSPQPPSWAGAPPQPTPGYGSPAAPAYGSPAAQPYGSPAAQPYGGPTGREGHGAAGYGPSGYDEPARYDGAAGQYGQPPASYESGPYQGGGYGQQQQQYNGYGPAGYEPQSGGGYAPGSPAGYSGSGGGYSGAGGGYSGGGGGYSGAGGGHTGQPGYPPDPRGGYPGNAYEPGESHGAHARPPSRADRRPLDWLDD